MKRALTGLAIVVVAIIWMIMSWFFCNGIAGGAQESGAPEVAEGRKAGSKNESAAERKSGGQWKHRHKRQPKRHHGKSGKDRRRDRGILEKPDLTAAQEKHMHDVIVEAHAIRAVR